MILTYTARERDEGRKLYYILRDELHISAALLRRLKRADAIRTDGETRHTDHRLRGGETVSVDLSAAEPPCGLVPETGAVDLLREDEGMLAVNKPSGLLVHPTHARYTGTLLNLAAGYLASSGEMPVCHAVNRLDRDTSGVVLLAKNTYMKSLLSDDIAAGEKLYLALAAGCPPEEEGIVSLPILRAEPPDMRRFVSEHGQPAVTRYRLLAEREGASLLLLKLETGRTHQIRVHLAALGCPVLGDRLYGTEASMALSSTLGIDRQALHAWRLSWKDTFTGCPVTVTAPVTRHEFDLFRGDLPREGA